MISSGEKRSLFRRSRRRSIEARFLFHLRPGDAGAWPGKGPKVDYKEVLKPAEFEVFSRLRE